MFLRIGVFDFFWNPFFPDFAPDWWRLSGFFRVWEDEAFNFMIRGHGGAGPGGCRASSFRGDAASGGFPWGLFSRNPLFLLSGFPLGLFAASFASQHAQVVGEHDPAQFLAA